MGRSVVGHSIQQKRFSWFSLLAAVGFLLVNVFPLLVFVSVRVNDVEVRSGRGYYMLRLYTPNDYYRPKRRSAWEARVDLPKYAHIPQLAPVIHYDGGTVEQLWGVAPWVVWLGVLCPAYMIWSRVGVRRQIPGTCIQCGYCLFGNESGKCPECGYATPRVS